jgi:hypothetical protein
MPLRSALRVLALFLLSLGLAAPRVLAQCGPDGYDGGPCCARTLPTVPNPTGFTQGAARVTFRNCGIELHDAVSANWQSFLVLSSTGQGCDEYRAQVNIRGPGNVLWWSGLVRLQYSRTWAESTTTGALVQVWRYLVNGDLRPTIAVGTSPDRLPPCAPAHQNRVRWTGYLDLAYECGTVNPVQRAWMLTHACDDFDHHPGFPRAGTFHPDRSYCFVGPGAGFVPSIAEPIEGTPSSPFEAIRSKQPLPGAIACGMEEPAIHTVTPVLQTCPCAAGPAQFALADLSAFTTCGTTLANPPSAPLVPGFVSMAIGHWTNPAAYPGLQSLRWSVGGYDVSDPCLGSVQHELYFGVTTLGGNPAFQVLSSGVGAPLPPTFIDQASSVNAAGTLVMNVPFVSWRILNFNH